MMMKTDGNTVTNAAVPPLVLLHGWGMHGGVWQGLAARLQQERQVLMPDMPGYAAQPQLDTCTLESLAEHMLADWPAQVDLCAWSLGGLVALTMARIAPQRIRRLVLVGSTPCFVDRPDWNCGMPAAVFAGFADALQQEYEPTLRRFIALQAQGDAAAREALTVLRAQLFARGRPGVATLRCGLDLLLRSDVRASVSQVMAPTLVVQGSHDRLVPPCAAHWLAARLEHGYLLEMRAAGHAPFLSHVDEFARHLQEFLSE